MTLSEIIEFGFADMRPMLEAKGRSITVKNASDDSCVIELTGFCQGGCACTESYMGGIEELIREKAPSIKTIEFVQS